MADSRQIQRIQLDYRQMDREELAREVEALRQQYAQQQQAGLKLDLSRGKPAPDQLALSMPMMDLLGADGALKAEDGTDTRNYGALDGIPEAKRLLAQLLEVSPDEIMVGGNSSLNLMHDCIGIGFVHGFPGGEGGWCKQESIKFLCPSPGYDRHFAVTEHYGIQLVCVPMTAQGPDMDQVEALVSSDPAIKGMWCIPKYSNPTGITYSDETVRRIAALQPAAGDFRVFWDNAYAVHDHHPGQGDSLLNLMEEAKRLGRQDQILMFTSTSKATFPGGGISAIGASETNIRYLLKHFGLQTIGYDKVNQLRHALFLPDLAAVRAHMAKHAALIQPKFQLVLDTLERELGGRGIAEWETPRGGYFISLDVAEGCAKRTVQLCKEAGVTLTPAGATFPYGKDPQDRNIRIAPTFATMDQVGQAAGLLCLCARLACAEKLLG